MQAAVSLAEINKTVVVVEKSDRLGGHCTTYVDPDTKTPVDYGVVIHQDLSAVNEFFGKFGVEWPEGSVAVLCVGGLYRPGEGAVQVEVGLGHAGQLGGAESGVGRREVEHRPVRPGQLPNGPAPARRLD